MNLKTFVKAVGIALPIQAVWRQKYPFSGMIRLSVGIENYEKLEAVFSKVLGEI